MEPVVFGQVIICDQGGDTEVELSATPTATVWDLRANVESDAVWLLTEREELGDLLEGDVILRDIPNREAKILAIIQSSKRGCNRPGDPSQVEVKPK